MLSQANLASVKEEKSSEVLSKLLKERNIDPAIFSAKIDLDAPIEQHAAWAFQIYNLPYVEQSPSEDTTPIARQWHGIQHASRVALYCIVLLNLWRKYGDQEALAVTENELTLLQITALLHDAARKNDSYDRWDDDSALLLYFYLYHTLKLPAETAKQFAEVIANKDFQPGKQYKKLIIENANEPVWALSEKTHSKTIYQSILQSSDSLDIMRCIIHFSVPHMDFYQQVALKNLEARDDLHRLVMEVRRMLAQQSDLCYFSLEKKKKYECSQAYQVILSQVQSGDLPGLAALSKKVYSYKELQQSFFPKPMLCFPSAETKEDREQLIFNWMALLEDGRVFSRGVPYVTKASIKHPENSQAAEEIYKTLRREGVATRTKKPDCRKKQGNRRRSIALIGSGQVPFSTVGFLINLDIKSIKKISNHNLCSGKGKKEDPPFRETKELERDLEELKDYVKLNFFVPTSTHAVHNEIIADITDYNAIYYCYDAFLGAKEIIHHPYVPILNAIFLQQEYARKTGILLPIFQYSGLQNKIVFLPHVSSKKLVRLWTELAKCYLENLISSGSFKNLLDESVEDIKINCMHGMPPNGKFFPADLHYPEEARNEISQVIHNIKTRLVSEIQEEAIKKANSWLENDDVESSRLITIYRFMLDHDVRKQCAKEFYDAFYRVIGFLDKNIKDSSNNKDNLNNKDYSNFIDLLHLLKETNSLTQGYIGLANYVNNLVCDGLMQGNLNGAMFVLYTESLKLAIFTPKHPVDRVQANYLQKSEFVPSVAKNQNAFLFACRRDKSLAGAFDFKEQKHFTYLTDEIKKSLEGYKTTSVERTQAMSHIDQLISTLSALKPSSKHFYNRNQIMLGCLINERDVAQHHQETKFWRRSSISEFSLLLDNIKHDYMDYLCIEKATIYNDLSDDKKLLEFYTAYEEERLVQCSVSTST